MLSSSIKDELHDHELRDHLVGIQRQHQRDLARGFGAAALPYALDRKYPNANREWIW